MKPMIDIPFPHLAQYSQSLMISSPPPYVAAFAFAPTSFATSSFSSLGFLVNHVKQTGDGFAQYVKKTRSYKSKSYIRHITSLSCSSSDQLPSSPSNSANGDTTTLSRRTFLQSMLSIIPVLFMSVISSISFNTPNAYASKKKLTAGPPVEVDKGVVYREYVVGQGNSPEKGDQVAIHYSLYYNKIEVESSRESQGLAASPVGFTYGTVKGPGSFNEGVMIGMQGMKVGGQRLIIVPPELAYKEKGRPPLIPPNATVEYNITLLTCKRRGTNPNVTTARGSQMAF